MRPSLPASVPNGLLVVRMSRRRLPFGELRREEFSVAVWDVVVRVGVGRVIGQTISMKDMGGLDLRLSVVHIVRDDERSLFPCGCQQHLLLFQAQCVSFGTIVII